MNTEPDIKEYRLYRTDTTRTLLGVTPHPNNSYPFTVTIPDGSSGTLTFAVTAVDTSNYESADSNPASYPYNLSLPAVTITATDNTATEAGSTTGTFTVTRTGSTTGTLTVYLAISGTATNGIDYNSLPNSVTFAAGSTTAKVTVTPINDTVVENDETVIVTLSTNSAYTIGSPNSAMVTITSDDAGEAITPPTTPSLSSSKSAVTYYRSYAGGSNMVTGTAYQFFTGGSFSSLGSTHPLEYQFSWGDGTYSSWGSPSRDSFSQSHAWALAGTYQVRARARCKIHNDFGSDWSNSLSISVQEKPFIHLISPNGGENLAVGASYTITWNSSYLNPTGTTYLFYKFDGAWHPITTLSPTATSYTWTVPRIPAGVTSPAPSSSKRSQRSVEIWIGNWANGGWECSDKSDESFRILYDAWICKISGLDQGGATLLMDEGSFEGYGISLKWGMFLIDGTYGIDAKSKMNGTYTIRDFANPSNVLASSSFTGKVDSASKKLTLTLTASSGTLSLSGTRFVGDPVIPGNWTGVLWEGVTGTLPSFEIDPYQLGDELYSNVFGFLGSGTITGGGPINIEGYFYLIPTSTSFLTSTNVYGIYRITETDEIGVLTGILNPSKGTISFNMNSQNGNKYTLNGNATQ